MAAAAAAVVVAAHAARHGDRSARRQRGATSARRVNLDNSMMKEWSPEQVGQLLRSEGFEKESSNFLRHRVRGDHLLRLDPMDYEAIGIKRLGTRIKMRRLFETLSSTGVRANAQTLQIPSWPSAVVQFVTFKWASTSEGKDGFEMKDEIAQANSAISLVSALLTAIMYDWFTSASADAFCETPLPVNKTVDQQLCFASDGLDMTGLPLQWFFCFSGVSATLFLCSTVISIVQIIMINEMSDEREIMVFLDYIEAHENLSGQLAVSGLLTMCIASFLYSSYTNKLGLYDDDGEVNSMASMVGSISQILIFAHTLYALARMVRNVYKAKINVAIKQMTASAANS